MGRFFEWLGEKIDNFTGENEHQELIEEFKSVHKAYAGRITEIVEEMNRSIERYNAIIKGLNKFRAQKVNVTLDRLYQFLLQFGHLLQADRFAVEVAKETVLLPEKQLESQAQYIEEQDWEKKGYIKTIFTIFGTRAENKKKNLALRESLAQYRLEIQHSEQAAMLGKDKTELDIRIAELYNQNIREIDQIIEKKILPEMELIEAFLEAESFKNYIVAKRSVSEWSPNQKITLLHGTRYEKHYRFVKNSFLFYLVCRKVYDAPVLTKLLNDETREQNRIEVQNQAEVLQEQSRFLDASMV